MADAATAEMARQRALLTDTEREILSGERDVKDNYRYSVESRVRSRITGPFADDVEVLRENYPELVEELEQVVLDIEPTQAPAEPGGEEPTAEATGTTDDVLEREMLSSLESRDIKGRPEAVRETRREAVAWAWRWLRDEGEARPRDIANATFDEFEDQQLGYSASSANYRGYQLWNEFLRDVLKEMPAIAPQGKTWSFLEPEVDNE